MRWNISYTLPSGEGGWASILCTSKDKAVIRKALEKKLGVVDITIKYIKLAGGKNLTRR